MSEFTNMNVAELQSQIAAGTIQIVDVRTAAETARGFIQGAIKLPLHVLPVHSGMQQCV